ncbi:ABC transporter ATP-binding protein [Spirochaetota bacterium]
MAILKLENIKKTYKKGSQEVKALKGIDLSIEKGEFLAIVGPSGSGKTTLLNIIGCLDLPSAGSVIYDGRALDAMSQNELSDYRKESISFIFQSYNLIPVLTVMENVELPLVIARRFSKTEIRAKAAEILEKVGLKDMTARFPRELSGGQEQRVAIARALVKKPLLVLADEPSANLDSKTAEDIINLMKTLNISEGTSFIFSTHDRLVEDHARRIISLHDGLVSGDKRK